MLKIAICDDVAEIVRHIESMLKIVEKKHSFNLQTYGFFSGAALLKDISEGNSFDLIFLDIEMDNINGVEVGLEIRNKLKDDNSQIAYISGKTDRAMKLFQVRPIDFLVKPLNIDKIEEVVLITSRLVNDASKYFRYKKSQEYHKIRVKDILYFEGENRKVNIVTKDHTDSFYGSMNDVYKESKSLDFLHIHKSYIVNKAYIKSYKYDEVIMTNDSSLPISQSRRKSIRGELLNLTSKRK